MATYAYRWADGSVSICSAKNKDDAAWLFDEIGPISRKLILKLKAPILVTLQPDIDNHWILDESQLGEDIGSELPEKCYPRYEKVYYDVMDMLDKKKEDLGNHPDLRAKIEAALEADIKEAEENIEKTPTTPDIVLLFPDGLPGQNN